MFGLGFTTLSYGNEGWFTDFEKAKAESKKSGKPILANVSGSDWCQYCVLLDEEVLSKKEFKEFAQKNMILLSIDLPKYKKLPKKLMQQNINFYKNYRVAGFPTVLLLDSTGKEFARTGYMEGGVETYIANLKKLLKK
jgi:thioredoxin-related protein